MDKESRGLLALLERGPVVADGRLECEIAHQLKQPVESIPGMLNKLERRGHIAVVRHGSVLREVCRVKEPVKSDDRASDEEQVVTPTADAVPVQTEEESGTTTEDETPLWEQLSLALLALQTTEANEEGKIVSSAPKILAEEADMPLVRAKYLCQKLRDLGFLELSGSRRHPVYVVDMEAKITPEVIKVAKAPVSETANGEDDAGGRGVTLTTAVTNTKIPKRTIAEQLADIIEGLESERDGLLEKVDGLTDENGRLRSTIEEERNRFDHAARQAGEVIARLRSALEECAGPPSDRVRDVLNRHGVTAP